MAALETLSKLRAMHLPAAGIRPTPGSSSLCDYAALKEYEPECLWARGIMPAQSVPSTLRPCDSEAISFTTEVPAALSENLTLATGGTLLKDQFGTQKLAERALV